jgi:hypothetical protein
MILRGVKVLQQVLPGTTFMSLITEDSFIVSATVANCNYGRHHRSG